MPIRSFVNLTKLEHLSSEYSRHSRKPIYQLEPFPVEDGYRLVEIYRITQFFVTFTFQVPPVIFFFPNLDFFRFFICEADLVVEIFLDELESFPRSLKRMSLNSATAVPVHIVLNSSYRAISPTSIIEGITS